MPAAAAAQQPIPEGDRGDAPAFIGGKATQQPLDVAPLAPRHPFMAPNGRSNLHDDAYQTDAYDGPGPLGDRISTNSTFLVRECASVTFDSEGRIVTVCVGLDRPVLQLMDPKTLQTLASLPLPPRQAGGAGNPFTDFTGGGYFYLDHEDRAVIPTTDRRIIQVDQVPGPGFRMSRDVDVSGVLGPQEKIVAAMPDWSGRIWFVGSSGIVGVLAPDNTVNAFDTKERITNSFAVDEEGGVYIVTDGGMYRFEAAVDNKPRVIWKQTYANTGVQKPGQVNAGSGTTPTLMDGGLVAITDNAEPMNVVVMRRGRTVVGSRVVCTAPVFKPGESATDNSLIAAGRSIVVENNHGYTGPTSTQNGNSTAPGIERVDVDLATGTCTKVWRSEERSPTVVPKLSLANGLVYVYVKEPTDGGPDLWYLTALDFYTGRTVYKALAGEGLGFNNNYAPVTLGPDGSAYVGVLGGLVRLADAVPPPNAVAGPSSTRPASGSGAGSGGRCLPARARMKRRGIRGVRLRLSGGRLIERGGLPVGRSIRFCVNGRGSVSAAIDARNRAVFVGTTGRRHRAGRLRIGRRVPRGARRVARGLYRYKGRYASVRRRRVRWIAVVARIRGLQPSDVRALSRDAGFKR
jgi:hypothetical protein